jgi:hypothetical protein
MQPPQFFAKTGEATMHIHTTSPTNDCKALNLNVNSMLQFQTTDRGEKNGAFLIYFAL